MNTFGYAGQQTFFSGPIGIPLSVLERMRNRGKVSGRRERPKITRTTQNGVTQTRGPWWTITTHDEPKPKPVSPEIAARLAALQAYQPPKPARKREVLSLFDCDLTYSQRRAMSPSSLAAFDHVRQQPKEHRAVLSNLYAAWRFINNEHFGGQLNWPKIIIGEPSSTRLACCHMRKTPAVLEFTPRALADFSHRLDDHRGVYGLLVHESVHAWQAQKNIRDTPLDRATGGHGEFFAQVANRIGKKFGLKPALPNAHLDSNISPRHWPHCTPAAN